MHAESWPKKVWFTLTQVIENKFCKDQKYRVLNQYFNILDLDKYSITGILSLQDYLSIVI